MHANLTVLSRDEIEAVHDATLQVLDRVGVMVKEVRARRLLAESGALPIPGTERVRIPEALLMEGIRKLPKRWTWHAREASRSFPVGDGGRTRLGPGSACSRIVDYATGKAREPTEQDGDDLVRLMDALHLVDINYTPLSYPPSSESFRYRETATLVRDLGNTSKVPVGPSYNGTVARDGLEIARLLAGGEEALRKRPMVAGYCDPVSPLTHAVAMTETLMEYAALGQPVFVTCLALAGASAPASLAGTLVQQNAEVLSGALIAFLVNPSTPVIYGSVSGSMDMKAGNAAVGGPEFGLMGAAAVQIAHFYGLPCSSGGQSDSVVHDAQASLEKGTTLLASMLAGADFVDLFFGSYEGFNATSPEQVVIDHEIAGYARRYTEGIRADSASLAVDLIEAVGPGGSYLKDPKSLRDTMSRMRTEWYLPSLFERQKSDLGVPGLDRALLGRAHDAAARILRDHRPAPLDSDFMREARAVLDRIRAEEARRPSQI